MRLLVLLLLLVPRVARADIVAKPDGTRVLSLDWIREYVAGSVPVPDGAYRVQFFLDESSRIARYDLWAGRVVRTDKASAATH